ncbi:MAG: hypothetical protein BMS9Abin29_2455 [Gemmatimonadota bacterium]|nr:MAG: hypothetical protein BMS9Abin29_2455 [Gemmatimonadota bacterium]
MLAEWSLRGIWWSIDGDLGLITLSPVHRALVPVSSAAANRVSGPNYDEFQDDAEIRAYIQANPDSIVRVTMAHADATAPADLLTEGSDASLTRAATNMAALTASDLTRTVEEVLWVVEMIDPSRPGVRQIGLGGMARTDEIRTAATPAGPIIRNEGVREKKARGRADLIERTSAIVGTVNNAVDDAKGVLRDALERYADSRPCDLAVEDERATWHRVWLVTEGEEISGFRALLAAEPRAYVADGNHRSAGAAMLGYAEFLSVFFPAHTMEIKPYNRLVDVTPEGSDGFLRRLRTSFDVREVGGVDAYQPENSDKIGLYSAGGWLELTPKPGTYDPANAAESIAAGIVQRNLFGAVLGIPDAGDVRLRFVGSNRDARYLQDRVDSGEYGYAVTLPAVTMGQFIEVCMQDRLMPPKSTWFEPKLRSGLVVALL